MIQFVDVTKNYKNFEALKNISFTVEPDEFILLTGQSGSGKTTLVKMLIREIKPSKGKIIVEGDDITRMWRWGVARLRRKIGVVFQDFKLLQNKNAYENVSFALEASGKKSKEIREIVPYVFEIVGLQDKMKAFPDELSGGQKQRVAIARALANNPQILIADEPTGNLDEENTWEIIDILKNINKWGTTVIMATHGTDIIKNLDQRTITLENGEIINDTKKEGTKSSEEFAKQMLGNDKESKPDKEKNLKEKLESINKVDKEKDVEEKIDEKEEKTTSKKIKKETTENENREKKIKSNSETPKKKVERKKPKLKIGLSKNKDKKKENLNEEELDLKKSTQKILKEAGFKELKEIEKAGIEKIKEIEDISGDQIVEIETLLEKK